MSIINDLFEVEQVFETIANTDQYQQDRVQKTLEISQHSEQINGKLSEISPITIAEDNSGSFAQLPIQPTPLNLS